MKYNASISDFFKSPKWGMNLLLGAVALIIPLVGQLVLTGWHVTGFWARGDGGDPAEFPPFDFQNFGKYLERGLWPFLVNLVIALVLVPLLLCFIFPVMIFSGAFHHGGNAHLAGPEVALIIAGFFLAEFAFIIAYQFIVTPFMLRATITQDFKAAFDFAFARDFLARVWREMLGTMVFLLGVGLCLMVLAVITCYIGGILAAPVAMFSWHHLQKQLYQLYLARGGQPVPPSPKLRDLPPPLPVV